MRAGACAVQQTLTSEAASVLKHSLTLARRRGHAQVTPLHVAATLLSSRASLLRRACLKSQPPPPLLTHQSTLIPHNYHHHPLQCRALELCFNVALNRLPTTPGPLLHGQPSLSNALIAALKRAQAHQRRGCIEQQQQQPLLTIKVELEQLIISILDDPSVSRVMREAGFSSTAVKSNVEDSSSSSSVFQCYPGASASAAAGVFSSPCSPSRDQNPKPSSTFWQTHFLTYSSDHHRQNNVNPVLFSSPSTSPPPLKKPAAVQENDVKLVLEVLMRKQDKKKNAVVVGDSVSAAEAIAAEVVKRVERGEVPEDLKSVRFVKFQFTPVVMRFMKRADVDMNVSELKRKVDCTLTTEGGGGVIIYAGDLKWTVESWTSTSAGEYNPVDHLVAEVGRLMMEYNSNRNKKVWLIGTASYQTYMKTQIKQPSLDLQWSLHAVSVPSADLALSLHANSSVHDSKMGLETKPFAKDDEQDFKLCGECKSSFDKEVQLLKSTQNKLLPSWLHQENHQKDDLVELKRKWNRLCHGLHQERFISHNKQKSYSYNSSYPWWPSKNTSNSNSISFVDSPLKPNQSSNSVPRFRRQQSCTIDFNFGQAKHDQQAAELSLDSLKNSPQGKEVRVTLALGNYDFGKSEETKVGSPSTVQQDRDRIFKILLENVQWQSETIGSIVEALIDPESNKNEKWMLIQGNDRIGKRRLAHAIAESICGSPDLVLHMNMRKRETEATPSSEVLGRALRNHEKLVVLVEDVDLADTQFLKFLADGFETGKFGTCSSCRAVFVLTKSDNNGCEDWRKEQDCVIQMKLKVSETILSSPAGFGSDHKRKAERDLDLSSKNVSKSPRTGVVDYRSCVIKKQPCFNTLDLNILAEEEESEERAGGEVSPISSDLTGETGEAPSRRGNGFLESIERRFVFNGEAGGDGETREGVVGRMRGCFEEVFGGQEKRVRFSVEERVVGEIIGGFGTFVNSSFEKWLKDVFQTSLKRVEIGGKDKEKEEGIGLKIRVCFGGKGKEGEGVLWDGYMGSSLPKKIQLVSFMD